MRRRLELMLLISKLTMIPRIYERLLMRAYNFETFLAFLWSLKSKSLHRIHLLGQYAPGLLPLHVDCRVVHLVPARGQQVLSSSSSP
jgi:hypothetical protein